MAYSLLSNRKTNYPEIISKYGWYDAIGYLDLGQTKAIAKPIEFNSNSMQLV
jgi:hypothetical protein